MASEQNPVALKGRRTVIKGSCTRIKTYVDAITNVTPSVIAQLEERKAKLNDHWMAYGEVQSLLEALDPNEVKDRVGYEDSFYALSARIREILQPVMPSRALTSSPSVSHMSHESEGRTSIRLPKLNLPSFSGKYDEWFPFFDSFNSIIHSNLSINKVQKLQYLKSCLTGDASNIISSLEISDLNYEVAWNLLKERYDNKRVIVQTHIKAIMELPTMTKENSSGLRRISDGATRHIQALRALKRPTQHWDDLIVHILSSKLDLLTLREWQSTLVGSEPPTFKQFEDFINNHCQMLEATSKSGEASSKEANKRSQAAERRQASCVATVKQKCNYCSGEHAIYYCKDFLDLSIPQRVTATRNRKLCVNCLRSPAHAVSKCTSRGCKVCKVKHNTLLHQTDSSTTAISEPEPSKNSSTPTSLIATSMHTASNGYEKYTMLSTAVVKVLDCNGSPISCRVLLDCGSQANFISRECVDALGLKPRPLNISISGISNTATRATQVVKIQLQSRLNSYTAVVDCIISEQITDKLPAFTMPRGTYNIPRNLNLADPQFNISSRIDILIGAEIFWELLCVGQIRSSQEHPTLQKTRLGWILAGQLSHGTSSEKKIRSFHATISNEQLQEQLSRFWQIEEVGEFTEYNKEENYCENHFLDNVSQTSQGRYVVKLPFKEPLPATLGNSRNIALRRLKSVERRLSRDQMLKTQYTQFMQEYLRLGHMKRVDVPPTENTISCYLPHHCVFKNPKQPSKIRVVFDASCKSDSGTSLNDILRIGPVIQQDLMAIVMRFRTYSWVLVADIIKMYRQVLVHSSQTPLQRILWRDDPTSDVQTYELATVTYGTSSASFLVTRCLKHLAEQHSAEYPLGATRVSRDFYVDDFLTGADTIQEAAAIRDQAIQLLKKGQFELSKWASNCPQLLDSIIDKHNGPINIDDGVGTHILGIQWNQISDTFHFPYEPGEGHTTTSKRTILSDISKLFDPLGLLGPTIVIAKLILQDLWRSSVQWDESVTQTIHSRWSTFKSQLVELNQLSIQRCVKPGASRQQIQIHGFCDASQNAYGACVYIRTETSPNEYLVALLCSKSRVAPMKATSLPRLELSAALLLAQLIGKIKTSIDCLDVPIFLWSDSAIVLNWISSSSRKWSVFVANRIGEIQRLTQLEDWRHVPSAQNPADILSRGLNPRDLINAAMWWSGPSFLQTDDSHWPDNNRPDLESDAPEMRKTCAAVTTFDCSIIDSLLDRRSNLDKVCRILAYGLRFLRVHARPPSTFVEHEETNKALFLMAKLVQQQSFPEEYKELISGKPITPSSRILSLNPFMDEQGLIRVGGRLKNSGLPFDTCHPILLPKNHELTKRIIVQQHLRYMHAGVQATMAAVRERFWPLSLRSTTRKILLSCVKCFKVKPVSSEALMGSLPSGRVTVSRPFSQCGVDYAGPLILREGKRRNARNHKAYAAIFVCFATKAIHVELVSDLTSEAFIAALKRFISRRGKPCHIYSDNGTTFVGAQNQLKELFDFLNKEQVSDDLKQFLQLQQTSWTFIPPNAPHCGGLWEAAVKSVKHHLYRVVGLAHLTFEEMQTILCEIESILNSRPLTALSTDPNDMAYLSPGHFLIGTTLNSLPSHDLTDVPENRLIRWQRVEQLKQHFWRRWSAEYLHSLQARPKWRMDKGTQLKPGQLVLIRQQDLPPLHWLLGRVLEVHVGVDGVVRTATVKTAKSSLTRPLSRLAILPIETS